MQLLPALKGGGVERGTVETAEALVKAGHRAVVVSAGGAMVADVERVGGIHLTLDIGRKSPLTLFRSARLQALIRETRADIVHARSRLPAWVAWRALKRLSPTRWPPSRRPCGFSCISFLRSVRCDPRTPPRG